MRNLVGIFLVWSVWALVCTMFFRPAGSGPNTKTACDGEYGQLPVPYSGPLKSVYRSPDQTREWSIEREGFPFYIRNMALSTLDQHVLVAADIASGKKFRFAPTIGDAPSQIAKIVPWRNSLIVWAQLEKLPLENRRINMQYRQFLVSPDDRITVLESQGDFEPWLADSQQDLLYSLEVRPMITGGQPREHDLPPQRVRVTSLVDPQTPPTYFPVRRLKKLFLHPSGDLLVLRWDRQYRQPGSWPAFSVFLERRSVPTLDLVWSTALVQEQGLIQYGVGPKLGVRFEIERDQIQIAYTKNRFKLERLVTTVSAASGEMLKTEPGRPFHEGC